jgi:anti-sigma factor RsiW
MECSQPGAVREEELLAYLAGEQVRPVVAQHLATCQYCASRLESYRRLELTLTSTLYRWDCPPSQVLGEYQLGLLSAEMGTAVRMHLGMCVHCAAELATLNEFLSSEPVLVENMARQPAARNHQPVQGAKQLLDQARERATAGARRIVATLLPPQPRFAYQRDLTSAEALWPRRYSAEDVIISVHVERGLGRRDSLQLIGFVTRSGAALEALEGTPVTLQAQAGPVQAQSIDELGNFVFGSLAPATYSLELQFPEGLVVVDQLQVALQD